MNAVTETQELAPTGTWLGPAKLFLVLMIVVGVLLALLEMATGSGAVNVGFFVVLMCAGVWGYFALWLANTRLLIGPGMVGYQNLFLQRTIWATSEIARVVEVDILYYAPRSGYQLKPYLLLVGADGNCLRKVRRTAWTRDAILAFEAATGHATEDVGTYLTPQAANEFPGSVGWMYAHPRESLAITGALVLGVGGLFEATILLGR